MVMNEQTVDPRALTPPDGEETNGNLSMPNLSLSLEAILHQVSPRGYEGSEQVLLAPNEVLKRSYELNNRPFFTESAPGQGFSYRLGDERVAVVTQSPTRLSELERMGAIPKGVEVHVIPTLPSADVSCDDVIDQTINETAQLRSQGIASKQTRRLKRDAYTDALTGIPNRRQYDGDRKKHLGFAVRGGEALYVGFVDVEAFTLFNNIYGPAVGDRVLGKVADALNFSVSGRLEDKCYRYGGDEFVPVVHVPAGGIDVVRERVMKSVGSILVPNPLYHENPEAIGDGGKKIWQKGDEYLPVRIHIGFKKIDTRLFRENVPFEKMRALPDDFYNNWFDLAKEEAASIAKQGTWRGREREYLALPSSGVHRRSLEYKQMSTQEVGRDILEGRYVI